MVSRRKGISGLCGRERGSTNRALPTLRSRVNISRTIASRKRKKGRRRNPSRKKRGYFFYPSGLLSELYFFCGFLAAGHSRSHRAKLRDWWEKERARREIESPERGWNGKGLGTDVDPSTREARKRGQRQPLRSFWSIASEDAPNCWALTNVHKEIFEGFGDSSNSIESRRWCLFVSSRASRRKMEIKRSPKRWKIWCELQISNKCK